MTRQMTREEYQHYSDCRQASFTYRKGEQDIVLFPSSQEHRFVTTINLQPNGFANSSISLPTLTSEPTTTRSISSVSSPLRWFDP